MKYRSTLRASLVLGAALSMAGGGVALEACVKADDRPVPGSATLTVSPSQAALGGFRTEDGWTLGFERVLVGIGRSSLGHDCTEYSSADYDRILDVTREPGQKLSVLYGLGTCDLRFNVGTPTVDALLGDHVTENDKNAMRTPGSDPYVPLGGVAVEIRGHAVRGDVVKRFDFLFRPRIRFQNCSLEPDAGPDAGSAIALTGPGNVTYDIELGAEAIFRDDGLSPAPTLRFEPFAAADTNADGIVTLEELRAVPIASLRDGGIDGGILEAGTYEFDQEGGTREGKPIAVTSLGDYVYSVLLPKLAHFQDAGSCSGRISFGRPRGR